MTTDDTYNGWTNRETWAVALWIDNEQGWYESVLEDVREALSMHEQEQYDGCVDCRQGDHSQDCGTDLDAVRAISPDHVGSVVRENVESVFDPENGPDGNSATAAVVSVMQDIGSLWRVDWREIGQHYITSVQEQDA